MSVGYRVDLNIELCGAPRTAREALERYLDSSLRVNDDGALIAAQADELDALLVRWRTPLGRRVIVDRSGNLIATGRLDLMTDDEAVAREQLPAEGAPWRLVGVDHEALAKQPLTRVFRFRGGVPRERAVRVPREDVSIDELVPNDSSGSG